MQTRLDHGPRRRQHSRPSFRPLVIACIAREFLSRNPNLPAWMALPAAQRAAELRSSQAWPLVCYAIGTDRIRLDVELAAVKQLTGLGRQPSWQARHLASSRLHQGVVLRVTACV